ncbi:MAG TPA: hypothetical protein VNJ53_08400 [Gaiellaceae bacterium]|nr:hypothetical protein [Gaiellaceae bacterium]
MSTAPNPWRCSQCGFVNEPESTSCRNCGKWASLFDLENDAAAAEAAPPEPGPARRLPELVLERLPETAPPPFEPPVPGEPPDGYEEVEEPRRGRVLRSLLVPLALVVYLLVSFLSER